MKIFFARTFAVALVLALTATGLWAGGAEEEPAAAADKKYVTDPTTGKVVVAPEYGGTLTYSDGVEPPHADPWSGSPRAIEDVVERLGMGNWAIDRDEYGFSCGRNACCHAPPAQFRTWSLNHPAPKLG